ncbi:MAG: hypothetical protein JNG84_01225, partial [Archangium sp.]|nr:hypothetical protein [Archangium sp.]
TYAPKNTYQVTTIANESLSSGSSTPSGWAEFGGDYFVMSAGSGSGWVTLWNSTWGGDQSKRPPVDTGIVRRFTVPSFQAGDFVDARVFAAATFTDSTSFARIRLVFNNPNGVVLASYDSDRLAQSSYGNLELTGTAIPAGAATVDVILNAYLGPAETSSFYAQNLSVQSKRQVLK